MCLRAPLSRTCTPSDSITTAGSNRDVLCSFPTLNLLGVTLNDCRLLRRLHRPIDLPQPPVYSLHR